MSDAAQYSNGGVISHSQGAGCFSFTLQQPETLARLSQPPSPGQDISGNINIESSQPNKGSKGDDKASQDKQTSQQQLHEQIQMSPSNSGQYQLSIHKESSANSPQK